MTRNQICDYDLVIVGGSFAGLVCARTAALRGLKVAVLDRKNEAGARLRTTGILVKEAAESLDLPSGLTRRIGGVRLYSPSLDCIDLHASGYYFLATDTAGLLRWLARQAQEAGAFIYFGTKFTGAQRNNGHLKIAGIDQTTRYLVGADGAHSTVAACFGLGRNRQFLFGVEGEYEGQDRMAPGFLHCFLDRQQAPGYIAWAVPGVGITQIGLATHPGHRPNLKTFIRKIDGLGDFQDQAFLGHRAGLIPAGGLVAPFATENVCLLGDAAGLVSPLTAGGIHNAFHFGRRMGQVVADYLQARGPEPSLILAREYPKYPV